MALTRPWSSDVGSVVFVTAVCCCLIPPLFVDLVSGSTLPSSSTSFPRVNRTTMKSVEEVLGTAKNTSSSPRPKLMVVFSQPHSSDSAASTPEHMFLYDRSSDVPEEPSKELLPPHQDADVFPRDTGGDTARTATAVRPSSQRDRKTSPSVYPHPLPQQDSPKPKPKPQLDEQRQFSGYHYPKPQQDEQTPASGYDYPKPQEDEQTPASGYHYSKPQEDEQTPASGYHYSKPQQDEQTPASGYHYPKPQQDEQKSTSGYHYPKPQRDEQTPASGYHYPKPQQDEQKPASGYHYPKPQQDEQKPASGYHYPKPQQDEQKPASGYHYPKPQQDDQKPASGYHYPKPQQDDQKPASGYHYPKPQQDEQKPASGYHYPKPQQDVQEPVTAYQYLKPQKDEQSPSLGYLYPQPQQDVVPPEPDASHHYLTPQQDEQKPSSSYQYPKPAHDEQQKSSASYNYPKPQQDEQTSDSGYQYPQPQQDVVPQEPNAGYHYSRPQQDEKKPSSTYQYPKPQQDVQTESQNPKPQQDEQTSSPGYHYPQPLQDIIPPETSARHHYLQPQQDEQKPSAGYHYSVPQQDFTGPGNGYQRPNPLRDDAQQPWRPTLNVEQEYLPPKQQLPLEDQIRPSYGSPASTWTQRPPASPATPASAPQLDDLPNSYLPPRPPPAASEQVRPEPQDSYLPPRSTRTPIRDEYLPPKTTPISITYPPPAPTLSDQPLQPTTPARKYIPVQRPQEDPGQAVTPSAISPVYLPSQQDPTEPPAAPSNEYLPSKHPDWPEYPPLNDIAQADKDSDDVLALRSARPRFLKSGLADENGIRVTDMSCLRTNSRARFTATITSSSFVPWPPVLDGVIGPPAPGCRVIADPADPHHRFLVDLSNPNLTRCGVKGCSSDGEARLCTRVLLPSLPGLRLAADPLLLLQCSLQPATGASLQQAKVAAVQPASGRSAGAVHAGGERAHLHAQLQLFRRAGAAAAGDFTRQMQPGSGAAVQLGDELQLRAVVRKGDGWQSSRLSDVVVRRLTSPAQDAVHIVSADGCVGHDMHAVCPRQQSWLAGEPLVSLLTMRVFMFRGMQDGEHLIISARVLACLDRADCKLDLRHCGAVPAAGRVRRATPSGNTTSMLEETVSFQVRLPSAAADPSGNGLTLHLPVRMMGVIAVLATVLIVFVTASMAWCRCSHSLRKRQVTGHAESHLSDKWLEPSTWNQRGIDGNVLY